MRSASSQTIDTLVEPLEKNDSSVQEVNLSGQEIDDQQLEKIAHALEANTIVESIDLRDNQITVDGVYTLSHLLAKNIHIRALLLDNNSFNEEAQRIIDGVVKPLLQHHRDEEITCTEVDLHACRHELITDVFFPLLPLCINLLSLDLS